MTFVGIIILLAAGFAFVMYRRSARAAGGKAGRLPAGSTAKALPRKRVTVQNLALNDIVSWMGQDWMVEGKLTYHEDGDVWHEYRLVDGADVRYLSVEDDDTLEVSLWEEVDLRITGERPAETLELEGKSYRCSERGQARVTREGATGRKEGMSCRYWDYEGPGEDLLSVERWGGDWEVSKGHPLREGSYDILPGDLVEDEA